MGAWGSGSFENDDASDWLADFCTAPNQQSITEALATIADMDASDYLEAPDCSVGIAAAEIVAAQKGAPNSDLTAETRDCIAKLQSANDIMVSLALKALERIRNNSELKELWDESETPAEWYDSVTNLEARLRQ
jgi:hypothetical protein